MFVVLKPSFHHVLLFNDALNTMVILALDNIFKITKISNRGSLKGVDLRVTMNQLKTYTILDKPLG